MAAPVCDEDLIAQVEELVALGVPPLPAVMAQGVEEVVFADWWQRGLLGAEGDEMYVSLREAILKAEARCEAVLVGRIRNSAKTNWQAAAWLLERRQPERYVRRSVNAENGPASGEPAPPDPFAELDDMENVLQLRRKNE